MLNTVEARNKILFSLKVGESKAIKLEEALGKFLFQDILSPFDMPHFDNSAMDGYALRSEETSQASKANPLRLQVTETLPAGSVHTHSLQPGEACRIFTGSMLPTGTDSVVMQEQITRQENEIILESLVPKGDHVRRRGEEIQKGQTLLQAGCHLNAAAIGLLASMGIHEVAIYSPPDIGILVTGSEIVTDLSDLKGSKIFDSNSYALKAALKQYGLTPTVVAHCADQKEALHSTLSDLLRKTRVLVVTGGVSVGDFDFVREVSFNLDFEEVLWKVKQKPGKPIYFAKKKDQYLFGLPGNPVSALVCFYEYVLPALQKLMGAKEPHLPIVKATLKNKIRKKVGRLHFLMGIMNWDGEKNVVEILEKQNSHMMTSLAHANCLALIPEDTAELVAGEEVAVHLLPSIF